MESFDDLDELIKRLADDDLDELIKQLADDDLDELIKKLVAEPDAERSAGGAGDVSAAPRPDRGPA